MDRRKHTLLIKLVSLILVMSCMVSGTAYAATAETVQPLASQYISTGDAYLSPTGSGRVRIYFNITTTSVMDELGVISIVMYGSSDQQVTWNKLKTYDGEEYVAMLTEDASTLSGYVTFFGVANRYYQAYVTFYASKNGVTETRSTWTSVVQAT